MKIHIMVKGLTHTRYPCWLWSVTPPSPFAASLRSRMADSYHSYLLIRDTEGYRRGRLFELNKDGSYQLHAHEGIPESPPVPIRCDDSVFAPLSEVECNILDGINSPADRCYVYDTPGKLEWGRSLKVGDNVLAQLPRLRWHGSSDGEHQHQYTTAIIRWYGRITPLYRFGVEITVSS